MRRNTEAIIIIGAVFLSAIAATPVYAKAMDSAGIDDLDWRASLSTGVALETGGITSRDPFLLYFGLSARKSWIWWYGVTFMGNTDIFTGLAEKPMVPYKMDASARIALGPTVFRMEILRGDFFTEFGGLYDYSTGTNFRFEASTLPTFAGDVKAGNRGEHVISYLLAPVQLVIGHYNFEDHRKFSDIEPEHNWKPYAGGKFGGNYAFIPVDWLTVNAGLSFMKGYGNSEIRLQFDAGASIGILDNLVEFSLDIVSDHWKTDILSQSDDDLSSMWVNTNLFILSSRLRI